MKSKTERPKRWEVVESLGNWWLRKNNWWLRNSNGRLVALIPRKSDAVEIARQMNRKAK